MSLASRKLIQATAGAAGAADTGDDDFANVVLLLDGDGTSGDDNNTFTDSSTNGFTVTESGSVVQGSFSPYGDNWSNYFDGSGDYLTVSANSFNTGGTWTIECWALWNSPNTGGNISATLINGLASDKLYFSFYNNAIYIGDNSTNNIVYSYTPEVGRWYHYALVKNGSTYTLYIDGTSVATSTTQLDTATLTSWQIGGRSAASSYWDGYISNMRVVDGTAVYTSDFTPSTSPLTAITNTSFLGCQSNRFKDNSTNNVSATISGTPKVTPFSPFKNDDARDITTDGGSAYFEYGAANALSIPADTNLNLSTGDFTVEMWVYLDSKINDSKLYLDWTNTSNYWQFKYDSAYGWSLQRSGGSWVVNNGSASAVKTGEWQHLALTRSGSNFTIWQNGESFATGTYLGTLGAFSAKNIGGWTSGSANSLDGYMSDFRLTKDTALYTSSFTPPTSPISAGANTELFLKFQDAGIYDRSGISNLDTIGNAQIDTAVTKYGTGSLEFGGTTDRLITLGPDLLLGTGDFTIEFWIYFNSVSDGNIYTILDGRTASDTSNLMWAQESSGSWTIYNGAGSGLAEGWGGGTFTTGVWYHLAQTRESGVSRFFKDGTQTSGDLSDTSDYNSSTYSIGGRYAVGGYSLDGYIDDFRITKGVARYTSDFTPPTDALPKF